MEEWCIALSYGAAASSNVGNIAEQTILAKKSGSTPGHLKLVQQYGYDYAHRLTTTAESVVSGGEAASPAGNWSMVNSYDRFGNRWATGSGISLDPMTPSSAADLDGATNQVKSSAGAGYDSAGYMTTHTLLPAGGLGYDAEGRLATYGTGVAYGYDGEGRRVKKSVTAGATTTVTYFIYDGSGSLAQEIGGSPQTSGVRYLTADQLGTTRVITDGAKAVKARCDYMPFGQVLLANQSTGQRSVIPEYACGEDVRQKFTGKERDAETGLDYFGARYMSATQGRFTSPDAPFADQSPTNPQSWNLYSYGRNNPLRLVDPDGRALIDSVALGSRVSDLSVATAKFAANVVGGWLNVGIAAANAATSVLGSSQIPISGVPALEGSNQLQRETMENLGLAALELGAKAPSQSTGVVHSGVAAGEASTLSGRVLDAARHNVNVTVQEASGAIVSRARIASGNMTAAEKAMGFPKGQLASHTEARAVANTPLQSGQLMTITGQRAPCPSCKGAMNRTANQTGATIKYQWRQDGQTNQWYARPKE